MTYEQRVAAVVAVAKKWDKIDPAIAAETRELLQRMQTRMEAVDPIDTTTDAATATVLPQSGWHPPAHVVAVSAEAFKRATGHNPVNDDLARANCPDAGKVGHWACGWCGHDKPTQFCPPCIRAAMTGSR